MTKRDGPTEEFEVRQEAASAVCYEMRTTVAAFLRLQMVAYDDRLARNAYLECTLLHARNMIEFFVGRRRGRNSNDIEPKDFVEGWNAAADRTEYLWRQLDLIDKHLSHLTRDRATRAAPQEWTPHELVEVLQTLFQKFIESVARNGGHHLGTFTSCSQDIALAQAQFRAKSAAGPAGGARPSFDTN